MDAIVKWKVDLDGTALKPIAKRTNRDIKIVPTLDTAVRQTLDFGTDPAVKPNYDSVEAASA